MGGYIVNETDSNMCDGMEHNCLSLSHVNVSSFYTDFDEYVPIQVPITVHWLKTKNA